MRKTILVLVLSSFPFGCSCSPSQSPPTAASTRGASPRPPTSSSAPAPGVGPAARAPIACSAAGLAAAGDKCLSPACGEIPNDMKTCQSDADCKVGSFALCEIVERGPYFSVNEQSYEAAFKSFRSKYGDDCMGWCRQPDPACVGGTCGFRSP